MSGAERDVPLDLPAESDIPWGALALAGMGLIAASLVAFVVVTDEAPGASAPFARLEPPILKRISVPELAAAPRADDATSSIPRTIRAVASGSAPAPVVRMLAAAPGALALAPDPRLVAPGPYGPLPRIGRDGARPSDVYARPASALAPSTPRVSIVVAGLGLDPVVTARAVAHLPAAVTLAFEPDGDDLEAQAAQAREAGHELLLQTHVGEDATDSSDLDALHWRMSRFSGYFGVMNAAASDTAFAPVAQEIAARGLAFLDDAASPASLAQSLAGTAGAPAARADLWIDASGDPEDIERALRRLEDLAREQGAAVGVARAATGGVDRIARFAQGLDARGVALVPLSAVLGAPARTSAR